MLYLLVCFLHSPIEVSCTGFLPPGESLYLYFVGIWLILCLPSEATLMILGRQKHVCKTWGNVIWTTVMGIVSFLWFSTISLNLEIKFMTAGQSILIKWSISKGVDWCVDITKAKCGIFHGVSYSFFKQDHIDQEHNQRIIANYNNSLRTYWSSLLKLQVPILITWIIFNPAWLRNHVW